MKITGITCHIVDGGGRNILFVRTETDGGIVGWGEAFSVGPDLAVAATIDHLKDWILGDDPRDIERLWATMYQGLRFPPGSVGLAAISGIEHTLWDISAKALGLPVYRLLGGRVRDRVRVYQGCTGPTPEAAAENALGLVQDYGYTAFKMSPFPPDDHLRPWNEVLREGPRHMAAVREAVGDDVDIGLDVHAKVLEPMRALELARAVEPYNPFFFEEPIRPEGIREMAWLRRRSPIPIATGEALYAKFQFNDLMRQQAADIIQPDVCVCGGLMEMKKIAAIAEGHDVVVAPHNPMGPLAGSHQPTLRRVYAELPHSGVQGARQGALARAREESLDAGGRPPGDTRHPRLGVGSKRGCPGPLSGDHLAQGQSYPRRQQPRLHLGLFTPISLPFRREG